MNSGNRIIFNTIVLYGRLILQMLISFFTTRLILQALGETNYGIYMLVGGTVSMLAILNTTMSNTSMRYMAYGLGNKNKDVILKVFNTTWLIHLFIGLATIIIMEVGGFLLFKYAFVIPAEKLFAAKIVFQSMVFTTFISIIAVPYDAVINAHENLLALAGIEIIMSVVHLLIALFLTYGNYSIDILILYGLLLLINYFMNRVIKQIYARRHYEECKVQIRKYYDKILTKEILSFTGWGLLGSIASVSTTKIKSIFINMFFGVKLNAGEGIANQVTSLLNSVSVNLTRAINPVLNKSEGSGDRNKMIYCTLCATKYSSFLYALFGIPLLIEAKTLLSLWLKDVPDYAVIFCQLAIISTIIEKFTNQIGNAIKAVGKVAKFQTTETVLILLYLPISYIIFLLGYGPESIYVVGIIITFCTAFPRLYFAKKIANIDLMLYLKNAVCPTLIPLIISLVFLFPVFQFMPSGFWSTITNTVGYMIMFSSLFFVYGITKSEKTIIMNFIKIPMTKIGHIKHKNGK